MKIRILMLTIATAALLSVGTERASAQIPWCPPNCSNKAEPKAKKPEAAKVKKQKKVKKVQAA